MKLEMAGFAGMTVLGIYLASLAQDVNLFTAVEHATWILGAAILAASIALFARLLVA